MFITNPASLKPSTEEIIPFGKKSKEMIIFVCYKFNILSKPILNIGILAHVDAGKTTITENILFESGLTRKRGSVDDGSTATDYMDIEKKRGISVRSAAVSFEWNNTIVNLIDTPGHVDFSAEVERVLRVLDAAIIVISAVEGVQSHTVNLVEALKDLSIPFHIFINKIDRDGADYESVLEEIRSDLGVTPCPIYGPIDEGLTSCSIFNIWGSDIPLSLQELFEQTKDTIIEKDDELMLRYLDEEQISKSEIWEIGQKKILKQELTAILTGVAKNNIGTKELLDSITELFDRKNQVENTPFSALVYKIENHNSLGRIAHVKIFDGKLKSKDIIFAPRLEKELKIGIVKKIYLSKPEDIDELTAGNIGIITGTNELNAGDIIGQAGSIPEAKTLVDSVMSVQVKPVEAKDFNALKDGLELLESEDPSLELTWHKKEQEFHLRMIGPMQIEILENQIDYRFGIKVLFEEPTVIYKERLLKKVESYIRYWMPKPCWAIMTFMIEPGEIGSGLIYESKVSQNDVHIKYQKEVERTIPKALIQGVKGWEVTDIKITLIRGEDHNIHSRPGDFILATPMGIMKGLQEAGTELLEPILSFTIKAPEEFLGKIASDLTKMRAQFGNPSFENNVFIMQGFVPASTSLDYSIRLNSATSGKGRVYLKYHSHEPCTEEQGMVREFKGVNPLDEAQWILHMRGAYKADER